MLNVKLGPIVSALLSHRKRTLGSIGPGVARPVTIDFIKNSGNDPSKPYIKTPGRLTRGGTTWMLSEPPAHK